MLRLSLLSRKATCDRVMVNQPLVKAVVWSGGSPRGQACGCTLSWPQSTSQSQERRSLVSPPARQAASPSGIFHDSPERPGRSSPMSPWPHYRPRPALKRALPTLGPALVEREFSCPRFPDQALPGHWAMLPILKFLGDMTTVTAKHGEQVCRCHVQSDAGTCSHSASPTPR